MSTYEADRRDPVGDNRRNLPAQLGGDSRLLIAVERKQRIVGLRRRGMTYEQIAEVVSTGADGAEPHGITKSGVAALVKRYLSEVDREASETVEELRALENERLDELLAKWGPLARQGDRHAAAIVLRISERRAKMNGLDAAQKVEHDVTGSVLHELGVDPDELARQREAFASAFGEDIPEADVVIEAPPDGD